jgi:signal transduction histidine kinase/tetratricopeptide (TPR) repeat protein
VAADGTFECRGLETVRLLGRGGQAETYEVLDRGTGRSAAARVPLHDPDAPLDQYRRIRGLRHPNLAAALRLTRDAQGRATLLSELVRGEPLRTHLPLLDAHRAPVALGVARGLAALHGWGLVHGDLSPQNILLETPAAGPPRPRLIDFGSAVVPGAHATLGYAAPERLAGEAPEPAADIYSLACLLHEILAGRPVFHRAPEAERVHQHLHAEPTLSPALSGGLGALLESALSKSPELRPSAEALLHDLAGLLGEGEGEAAPSLASTLLQPRAMVGRASQMARLEAACAALQEGRGGVFVLSGEPGSGRRSLADRAQTRVVAAGGAGVHVEVAGRTAFHALSTAFSADLATHDATLSAVRAITRAAETRPLCVTLYTPGSPWGELQHTWELLMAAARAAPVLALVLTDANTPVGSPAHRMDLPALQPEERADLLQQALGPTARGLAAARSALERAPPRTPGQLNRWLEHAVDAGALRRGVGTWMVDQTRLESVAAGPAETPAAAAAALPQADVELLGLLVLAGRPLRTPALARLTGRPSHQLVPQLQALMDARLVDRTPRGFTAPGEIQSWVGRTLTVDQTRSLHRQLAVVTPTTDYAGRLLHGQYHRVLGGAETTLEEVLLAVSELARRHDPGRARVLLDATEARPGWSPVEHTHLRIARAELMIGRGDAPEARAALLDLDVAHDQTLVEALGQALNRCGAYPEVLARLGPLARSPAARLDQARAMLWTGNATGARALAETLTEDSIEPALAGPAWHVRATCAWLTGDAEAAERLAFRGLAVCEDRAARADLFRSVGAARFYQGRHEEAREVLAEATTENRALGRIPELAKCLNNMGMVDYARGDWRRAAETWDEFRLLCARVGDPVELANACNNLGFLRMRLGRLEEARGLFQKAAQIGRDAGYSSVLAVALGNVGEAELLLGDFDDAEASLDACGAEMGDGATPSAEIELGRRRVELQLARGEVAAALSAADALLDGEASGGEGQHLERLRGQALRLSGRAEEALAPVADAAHWFAQRGSSFDESLCQLELARSLWALSRGQEAAAESRAAVEGFLGLGAQTAASAANALHRELMDATVGAQVEDPSNRALLDVALRLGATLDLDRLVPLVLEKVVRLVKAERGLFALFDAQGEPHHAVGHNLEWAGPGHPLPVSQSVLAKAMETDRIVVVQDVEAAEDYTDRVSVRMLGLRSMVGIPVVAGGRTFGVIYVDSRTETLGDLQREIELLAGFAALVGVCVNNAELFAAQRMRANLLASMAHDFRAPLSALLANSEVLGEADLADTERTEILSEMVGAVARMARMIDNTLELSRMDATADEEALLPLPAGAVDAHVKKLTRLAQQYNVTLELQQSGRLPSLMTRADRLWIVLDNLVFNALKFATAGTVVTVGLRRAAGRGPETASNRAAQGQPLFLNAPPARPTADSQFIEFRVHNWGPPIPEALRPHLFNAYSRAGAEQGVKSTGLGLWIVDQCVTHMGGRVWVESDAESGTTFRFTLPTRVQPRLQAHKTPLDPFSSRALMDWR